MVAQAENAAFCPRQLPSEGVVCDSQNDDYSTQSCRDLNQEASVAWVKVEDHDSHRGQTDGSQDQDQGNDIHIQEIREQELLSAHQAAIEEEVSEGEDEEDELEENRQDSSLENSGDRSCVKKRREGGIGSLGWRKKSQQNMEHCKQWIMENLIFVTTSLSMVSLSSIEEAYNSACQEKGQEPLNRTVLARLIHQKYPVAGKCRPGPRRKQKIHYKKLQLKVNNSSSQHHVNGATSNTSGREAAGQVQSDNIPSTKIQGKDKDPEVSVRPKDVKQGKSPIENDESVRAAREAIARAALQPVPEEEKDDQEGCKDASNRLGEVVKSFKNEGKLDKLLEMFAHSASCNKSMCSSLCLMFRRVRHHVISARHACHVMRIYSVLLKLHVAFCRNDNCGMTACPALRASRQMKRGRDEEMHQEEAQLKYEQDELHHTNKRLNVASKRLSSLSLRIPSPACSLPDSEPSTPSPAVSPSYDMPVMPVRIPPMSPLPLQSLRRIRVSNPTEHGGA